MHSQACICVGTFVEQHEVRLESMEFAASFLGFRPGSEGIYLGRTVQHGRKGQHWKPGRFDQESSVK